MEVADSPAPAAHAEQPASLARQLGNAARRLERANERYETAQTATMDTKLKLTQQQKLMEHADAVLRAQAEVASPMGMSVPEAGRSSSTPAPTNLPKRIFDLDNPLALRLGLDLDDGDQAGLDEAALDTVAAVRKELLENYKSRRN